MPTQTQWDQHWLKIAQVTAQLSKDPTTKVGAVVVSPDNRQCSIGYNGFASGIEETPEKWERPEKYDWSIHAEENALFNSPFDKRGCSVYITLQPCHKCIGKLRNAGIKRVLYTTEYWNLQRKDIWDETAKLFDEVKQIVIT